MSECSCCPADYNSTTTLYPPFKVTTSEFDVSVKELTILGMIFLLLIYSILAFLNNWKKNYRDISSSCQYTQLSQHNDSSKQCSVPGIVTRFSCLHSDTRHFTRCSRSPESCLGRDRVTQQDGK